MSLLTCYLFLVLHPLHISVTEVSYSAENKSLQIITRMFIDDLEEGIRSMTNERELDILEPGEGRTTDGLVKAYLLSHLKFTVNGKAATYNFLGTEKEGVSLVCYLEIEKVRKLKTLEVSNTVLTDNFEDQSNLVHVEYKGPVKSVRLMRGRSTEVFTFDKTK